MELDPKSLENLLTCDHRIFKLIIETQKRLPRLMRVLYGFRGEQKQNELYLLKRSSVKFPNSRHNSSPSEAVDVCWFDTDWQALDRGDKFEWSRSYYLIGFIQGVASEFDIKLRVGADWDGDFYLKDQKFYDVFHIELARGQ